MMKVLYIVSINEEFLIFKEFYTKMRTMISDKLSVRTDFKEMAAMSASRDKRFLGQRKRSRVKVILTN